MKEFLAFFGFFGLVLLGFAGVAFVAILALGVAVLTAPYWVYWQFPPSGTAEGEIARIAWNAPASPVWTDPPVDISAKVCPLVDGRLTRDVLAASGDWHLNLGQPCFTQTRTVRISFEASGRACRATVRVEPGCSI